MDLLFVYGTLRSEFDNRYAKLLRSQSEFVGPTTVMGSVFRIAHFTGYRPEPPGEVHGELYRLNNPAGLFQVLDEYEGVDFERMKINGAWIYQYRTQPPESDRIVSGDFRRP